MTKQEFDELIHKLGLISQQDGDLGYAYWNNVIKQLRRLYEKTLASS